MRMIRLRQTGSKYYIVKIAPPVGTEARCDFLLLFFAMMNEVDRTSVVEVRYTVDTAHVSVDVFGRTYIWKNRM